MVDPHSSARGVGKNVPIFHGATTRWHVLPSADSGGTSGWWRAGLTRPGAQGRKAYPIHRNMGAFQLACLQLRTLKVSILKCTEASAMPRHVITAKFAGMGSDAERATFRNSPSLALRSDVVTPCGHPVYHAFLRALPRPTSFCDCRP